MITLKHLARDYNIDPYKLRGILRAAELSPQEKRRWRWNDKDDTHYQQCITTLHSKGYSPVTTKSPKP